MASNGDLKPHEGTYAGFVNFVKYGTIFCVLIAAFVVWLIAA